MKLQYSTFHLKYVKIKRLRPQNETVKLVSENWRLSQFIAILLKVTPMTMSLEPKAARGFARIFSRITSVMSSTWQGPIINCWATFCEWVDMGNYGNIRKMILVYVWGNLMNACFQHHKNGTKYGNIDGTNRHGQHLKTCSLQPGCSPTPNKPCMSPLLLMSHIKRPHVHVRRVSNRVDWVDNINLTVSWDVNLSPFLNNMSNGVLTSTWQSHGIYIRHPLWTIC